MYIFDIVDLIMDGTWNEEWISSLKEGPSVGPYTLFETDLKLESRRMSRTFTRDLQN